MPTTFLTFWLATKNKTLLIQEFLLEGMIFVRPAGFFWSRFSP